MEFRVGVRLGRRRMALKAKSAPAPPEAEAKAEAWEAKAVLNGVHSHKKRIQARGNPRTSASAPRTNELSTMPSSDSRPPRQP